MPKERPGAVRFQGTELTILGEPLEVGMKAPDFEVLDKNLAPIRLGAFKDKVRVIASVPSIDTTVCDMEARRFNKAAQAVGEGMVIMTISMDLPFALDRWCLASHAHEIYTFSDHRHGAFGTSYGTLIKELRLLSRAVFIVDREGVLRYVEYVEELSDQPDYDKVLGKLADLLVR